MSKEKKKGARKPLRRAEHWTAQVPRLAGRLALSMVVVVVLGMLFSTLQGIQTIWLRLALSTAVVAAMLALFFSEGLSKGGEDAAASRFYMQMQKNGHTLERHDDEQCYHPLKAALSCAAVFGLPLLLAVYLCIVAEPYTYALQDLPTWLTGSFGARGDIMGPLSAYMQRGAAIGPTGWIRVFVRLFVMSFVNLFQDPLTMTATIDRLSPLLVALYPIAFMIGYFCGPRMQRKQEKDNRRAKKIAVRKAQKSNLAQELTGEQNAVHYGQRRDSEKPKKKELV